LIANGCIEENQKRCSQESNHKEENCYGLCHLYEDMKRMPDAFKPTTIGHAVVVSGLYIHAESGRVLWRVLDSNPMTRLNLKKSHRDRTRQGSVNFLTTRELYNRMIGTLEGGQFYHHGSHQAKGIDPNGHLRMLEVVPDKRDDAQGSVSARNLIKPIVDSNFWK
jgi:hypothetical protein